MFICLNLLSTFVLLYFIQIDLEIVNRGIYWNDDSDFVELCLYKFNYPVYVCSNAECLARLASETNSRNL